MTLDTMCPGGQYAQCGAQLDEEPQHYGTAARRSMDYIW